MLAIFPMHLLKLTLVLLPYKISDQKDLNFMDSDGTQYAIFPEKSLDYPTAKKTCTSNDAHLPQFASFEKLLTFEKAFKETHNFKINIIRFWISAIKFKQNYNIDNSTIWKADDGSGETLPRFLNQSLTWVDDDAEDLEPKECLTFGFPGRSFVADHCSNRNNVLCMRPLTNFGLQAAFKFMDQFGYQYVYSADQPLNYSEAKSLCLGHRTTLVSFRLSTILKWFKPVIRIFLARLRDNFDDKIGEDFNFWLSATRTADKYTDGDNIWNVDDGSGTVLPRLSDVTWNDSAGAAGNNSADCLYFNIWENFFQAADCSKPQKVICTKTPLDLGPHPYVSSASSQTNATDPDAMAPVNMTFVNDRCSGITLGTKVLSCLVAVAFVISVITSILCIRNIGKSKPAHQCDKQTPRKSVVSRTASKNTKRRSIVTKYNAKSTGEAIFRSDN